MRSAVSETPIDEPAMETTAAQWDAVTVLSGGHAHDIGRFQFFVAEQRWVWSDEVARMHGYRPGQVQPTTELLLSHKHPDDRAKVADILQRVQSGGLFSSRHRIVDVHGQTHWMVVVSDHLTDSAGKVIGTQGYYIDVTASLQSDLTAAMGHVVESRAAIEQAKGILMIAYDVDDARAFEIPSGVRRRPSKSSKTLRHSWSVPCGAPVCRPRASAPSTSCSWPTSDPRSRRESHRRRPCVYSDLPTSAARSPMRLE
ncbi:hypothetical protein MTY66_22160 [Mycolicibacterium sp. TY66]|nr:hypothetical protein MTY66_22160 [Mycolicibacterium sp. TY66]BCJ81747.1 hypothetical protein MTY81_31200 [Mycolicibacterium sp. TY81]